LKTGLAEYENVVELLRLVMVDIEEASDEELANGIEQARNFFPSDMMERIKPFLDPKVIRMIMSDVMIGLETIKNLSDFRWCASKDAMKLVEDRVEKYGADFFHLTAKETLCDTYEILTRIGIL